MRKNLHAHLYCSACVAALALCVCSAGIAQAQSKSSKDDQIETVVVTGQRAALQSAVTIKQNADVVVDSVAAEDVGKLPDNSITEVLQRLPGVNITRIQAGGSSETYLGEGTGVTIRGLTSTVSLLNGRDSFSAANGRNLAWEDIPPELAQGIDVYKSLSSSLPEGGFGGVVNLRTRQPFDFDGFTASATMTGNYADWSKKGHLGAVGMISDRWDTKIGEIGLLLNVAYSDLSTKADGVQVLPYFPTVYNASYANTVSTTLPSLSNAGSTEVYMPGGIGFTRRNDDRVRMGLYAAAQWRPSDNLLLFLTAFNSHYKDVATTYSMALGSNIQTYPGPDSTNVFDSDGNLTSTSGLSGFMWGFSNKFITNQNSWGYSPIPYTLQTQYSHTVNETTDISLGGEWHPSDAFSANFALQYVDSSSKQNDASSAFYMFLSGYSLTLSKYGSSTLPQISMADDTIDLTNPDNYGWNSTMPHKLHNYGRELAAYVDTVYTLSDTAFLRSIKAGLKLTYRNERDNETTWNWRELSPWYISGESHWLSEDSSAGSLVDLSNLFEGKVGLPSAIYFPTVAASKDPGNLQTLYNGTVPKDNYGDLALAKLSDDTLAKQSETTETGYVMANFADDDFIVPYNGNVGVRIVTYRDQSTGNRWSPSLASSSLDANNTILLKSEETPSAVSGGHKQTDVLPSLNVQFLPTPETHIRLAFSQAVNRPTFAQMNPRGYITGAYIGKYISYFSGNWGDPNLKPEKAEQLDGSVEYYFPTGGMVHFSAFWKNIHNYISTQQAVESTTFTATVVGGTGTLADSTYCSGSGTTAECTVDASVIEYFNERKAAHVDGYEIGIQKYADFLPSPFDGIGIDFNYTYIDSSQPGAQAFNMKGVAMTGLPVTGLSKHTINIAGMYDKGPFSFRMAYNWRSAFLVSTAAWQTAGTYNYTNNINYGATETQGAVTHYSLPVYQYALGTLDANLTYNLTDDVSWTMEASNLTRATTRLYMDEGAMVSGEHRLLNRSWYMADTRYTMQLRVKF